MKDKPEKIMKPGFSSIARSREVVTTAARVALLVGTILVLINHGEAIFGASLSGSNLVQILLTYLVPYGVSTYSSVKAIQNRID